MNTIFKIGSELMLKTSKEGSESSKGEKMKRLGKLSLRKSKRSWQNAALRPIFAGKESREGKPIKSVAKCHLKRLGQSNSQLTLK